jgi:DnaJ-class molecular chaperone
VLKDEYLICERCDGSGEGPVDGSTCQACKGDGEVPNNEGDEC